MQSQRVAHAANLDALGLHADTEFWVLPYAPLDDVGNMLQGGREVLQTIVAECDVVGEVRIVSDTPI